ncbi:cell envelope-related function transcriptional attenuator common domain-containing protein [Micromonospora viridifaciens]|uniref:Cell envelope-related function transcriptional attenuator common domain-containing protein n=1 Tax=Micromonospora viridifaciens TaxID=1881 RepID=A0A1C4UHV0_MICVI|nr:LCP family protein [Micromonospora viridifaciens]SCE71253.1 cell envelope-related function transcriptional attenuator common domain-containing protein [Micromonospora viridifaciens]
MPVQTSRRPPSLEPGAPGRVPPIVPPRPGPGDRGPGGAKKKKRTKRKDPLWARLTLIFGAVLMMTSGIAIVGSKALIGQATSGIAQRNLLGGAGKTEAEGGKNLDGPIDMLLLGVDARERWAADDVRADTIIILHIPASHDQAYLISIPRDTEAEIPGHGTEKINSAFFFGAQNGGGWEGGAQLMAKTIKNMTGISFDGAAIINFGGFKGVIDALGSVRICVSHEVPSHHMSLVDGKPMWNADAKKTGKPRTPVVHKKGCRQMAGWEALDYARQRYGLPGGDYDRQQNQQQLIKAMAKKATEKGMLTNPIKLKQLINAAGKAFILDTGQVDVADFIFTLKGVTGNDLITLRTNGGTFATNANNRESLNELSVQMFTAVKQDKLADFVVANPEVLSTRK